MEATSPTPTPQEHAAAYGACRARVRTLLAGLTDADAATVVPACPDWSVRDLCAHLAGVCHDLATGRLPGADVQAWVDAQVAGRSGRTVVELLDEWDEHGPAFEAAIVANPRAFAGLVYDVVAHEHDLAHALGRHADRTSDGVRCSVFLEAQALERDLRRHELPAVVLSAGGTTWTCGDGTPGLRLDLGDDPDARWELMRVLGSRRSRRQLDAYPWDGDLDRFLPALAHLPLPIEDLVEC